MPPQETTTLACNSCRTCNEECTWNRQDNQCDRCIDHGLQCRRPRPARASSIEVKGETRRASTSETEPAASTVFRSKNHLQCNTCRRHHQTCRPLDRVWPQKCVRCIERGYDCTPPRSKLEYEQDQMQEGRTRRVRARRSTAGRKSSFQQHTEGRLMLVQSDLVQDDDGEDEEQSDSASDREQESSILVGGDHILPPAKRQRADNGFVSINNQQAGRKAAREAPVAPMARTAATPSTATEPGIGHGSAENDLQNTILTMEEEFQEVLRVEQERHDAEIRTLKAKYEQELAKQRERYEGRIDDLIKIMKSIGRVD